MNTVSCIWCGHTETGEGYAPFDTIMAHQIEVHGQRKMRCGCEFTPDGKRVAGAATPERKAWWTCDEHSPARIKQLTAWQNANYQSGRWAKARTAEQETLFSETEAPS